MQNVNAVILLLMNLKLNSLMRESRVNLIDVKFGKRLRYPIFHRKPFAHKTFELHGPV